MDQSPKVARKAGSANTSQRKAPARPRLPGALLSRAFFLDPPERVAPRLLGKLLVCQTPTGPISGRIVEVEAYQGPHNHPPDPAAHSHRGPTPRNLVLFGPPAHAYVYAIYGRYFCMNVSCEPPGKAGCILVRALEPANLSSAAQMAANRGLPLTAAPRLLASGPSRLCLALGLTRAQHNGLDLLDPTSPLQLRDDGFPTPAILVTPRIGIKHAVDWPLRFLIAGHPCVSGPAKNNRAPVR